MLSKAAITALVLMVVAPRFASGGPPLLTNDPGTPGAGKWENNIALVVDHRHGQTRFDAPDLDLNYGVGERIQLTYEVPFVFLKEEGSGTRSGLGNSVVGVKWRFLDEESQWVSASVFPQFEFNNPNSSADRGLADEGTTFLLPVQAERKLGAFTVGAEAGRAFRQRASDNWFYGLSLGREIRKGFDALAEVHGESRELLKKHEAVANVGATWEFIEKRSLLFSIGRSLRSAPDEPSLLLYLGVQFRS